MTIREKLEDLLIQATKEAISRIVPLKDELERAKGEIADKDKRIDALNEELMALSIQQQYELETWNKEVVRLKEELAHVKDTLGYRSKY
jgi:predicted  nucleic acid-binding Zn-ribbon protein